ncbi:helix-turn-helix domain-containing protein [Tenacibaculum maritimum]|uniref:helix-turn-helix domain-containing protein n=1 Tax=Tenacibaculum maritimum TaxID=107401 RepID=UPI0038773167
MVDIKEIGVRLKYVLDKKDIKKGALAKEIGVHASTISNYIEGKVNNPSGLILDKVISQLNLNKSWLYSGIGEIFATNIGSESNEKGECSFEKNGVEISVRDLVSFIANNEEEFMKHKVFSNIIEVRVAKRIAEITISKEELLKYLKN